MPPDKYKLNVHFNLIENIIKTNAFDRIRRWKIILQKRDLIIENKYKKLNIAILWRCINGLKIHLDQL